MARGWFPNTEVRFLLLEVFHVYRLWNGSCYSLSS